MPQEKKKKSPYVKSQGRKVKKLKREFDAEREFMSKGMQSGDPLRKAVSKIRQRALLKQMREINRETTKITRRKK